MIKRALDIGHRSAHRGGAIQADHHVDGRRQRSLQEGQGGDHPIDGSDDVGAGLAEDDHQHAGLAVKAAHVVDVGVGILNVGHIAQANWIAVLVGDNQRTIVFRFLELVVGRDHPALAVALQRSLGLVGVFGGDRGAHRLQAETHIVQGEGIGLDANRGLRRSADEDLADAFDLGQLLSHDRVGRVVHLVLGERVGGERQNQDGRVGRIDLAVVGIVGQIRRQIVASRVDGGLHVTRRGIDVAVQIELHGDAGRSQLAHRGHLVDAGDAAELPLQRSGYGRRHSLRTGAGQRSGYADNREVDLRQRGDRQLRVGQGSRQQQGKGQQRSGYRPLNRW